MIARAKFILIGLMLYLFHFGQAAIAGEEERNKSCKDKITAVGRPNRIQSLSSMSAIIQWTQRADELGNNFGQWHTALNADLSCKLMKRSGYYICYASGKPCQSLTDVRAAIPNQGTGKK